MIKNIYQLIGWLIALIMALSAVILPALTIVAAEPVNLILSPALQTVQAGDTFEVIIQAQSGSQEVVGVDAYLDFDPARLAVVDMNSRQDGIQISGGTTLNVPLWNSVNNATGHIDYSAGAFNPYPHGTFTLATIRFLALAATSPTTTVVFSTSFERPTLVMGDTQATNATGTLTAGTYTLNPAITTPAPSGGGGSGGGSASEKILDTSGFAADAPLTINSNGLAQNSARLSTEDGQAALSITAGTSLLSGTGNLLSKLTAEALDSPPATPPGNALILAYTFGPPGATFNPAILLSLSYNPANLPKGVAETDLHIAYYDGAVWRELPSTVDPVTRTASARISHFSIYALISKTAIETIPPFSASNTPAVAPSGSQLAPGSGTAGTEKPGITPTPSNLMTSQSPAKNVTTNTAQGTLSSTPAPKPDPDHNLPIITAIMFTLGLTIALAAFIFGRERPAR